MQELINENLIALRDGNAVDDLRARRTTSNRNRPSISRDINIEGLILFVQRSREVNRCLTYEYFRG